MITINEIARKANVSRTTVSRFLNNSGYISEGARDAIMQAVEETGYVPSQYAKSLRTKKTKIIGVILPKISTETSSAIVIGMDHVFSKDGYQILLVNTNQEKNKEIEYLKLLVGRRVDGIVLVATNVDQKLSNEINNVNIPFVAVGQDFPNASCVMHDDYSAAKELTSQLIKKGKDRIAFIGVSETDRAVGVNRKNGYLDALKENNFKVDEKLMEIASFNTHAGYNAMKKIFETTSIYPNGLFAVTDRLAIGAMAYLKERKIKIPQDISVGGIGISEMSKYVSPSLTTIEYDQKRTGCEAARLLLSKIDGSCKEDKKIMLNYTLIQRESM